MAIADFEELCKGVCEVGGAPAPELMPNERGTWSATVHLRGVEVTVMQFGTRAPGTAFLVAEFGELPQDHALAGWLALMNANLHMAAESAPAFSRDPETGKVLLQWACPLWAATVVDVYQRISEMVDLACRWHEDYFLGDASAAYSWALPAAESHAFTDESRSACASFDALFQGVCTALGKPEPPMAPSDGPRLFALDVDGVDAAVVHSPEENPASAIVVVRLGNTSGATQLQEITDLMEANFILMPEAHGARFSREGARGQLLLQYAFPLAGAQAEVLLSHAGAIAALAREWQDIAKGGKHGHQ
jgi:hypothetical protein